MLVSLIAAVVAALCYGVASVMQAVAVREASNRTPAPARAGAADPGLLPRMLHQWRFVASVVIDTLGFLAQLVALQRLPLFAVQAMVAAEPGGDRRPRLAGDRGVPLLAGVGGRDRRRRRGRAARLVGRRRGRPPGGAVFKIALIVATAALGVCGLIAARLREPARTLLLGTIAGLGYGVLGVAARVLTGFAPLTLIRDPAAYAVVAGGIISFVFYTTALEGGSVTVATAAVVLAETLPPAVIGVLFLGDTTRPGLAPVAVIGFVIAVASAVVLARFGEAETPGHPPRPAEPPARTRRAPGEPATAGIQSSPRQLQTAADSKLRSTGLSAGYMPVTCYPGGPWTCGFTPLPRKPREHILAAAATQSNHSHSPRLNKASKDQASLRHRRRRL